MQLRFFSFFLFKGTEKDLYLMVAPRQNNKQDLTKFTKFDSFLCESKSTTVRSKYLKICLFLDIDLLLNFFINYAINKIHLKYIYKTNLCSGSS